MIDKLIPVLSVIAGILVTQIFNLIHRKADFKERLFFESYQKRIAVYEEVVNFLSKTTNREITLNAPPVPAAEIYEYIHTLEKLLDKLAVFGNYAFRLPLDSLRGKLLFMYKNAQAGLGACETAGACEAGSLLPFIVQALNEFTVLVRVETGADFVDKRIGKINNVFTKKIKKPKGDNKANIKKKIF
jgi:hypothetical protein